MTLRSIGIGLFLCVVPMVSYAETIAISCTKTSEAGEAGWGGNETHIRIDTRALVVDRDGASFRNQNVGGGANLASDGHTQSNTLGI